MAGKVSREKAMRQRPRQPDGSSSLPNCCSVPLSKGLLVINHLRTLPAVQVHSEVLGEEVYQGSSGEIHSVSQPLATPCFKPVPLTGMFHSRVPMTLPTKMFPVQKRFL